MASDDESSKILTNTIGQVAGNVYSDILSPAARRVGSAIDTVFKVSLSPVSMLDWGYEKSKDWLEKIIAERKEDIPSDCFLEFSDVIAIPAITQIAMSADQPALRNLYAELLLKSMDSRTINSVHPSYITLISQLAPGEALILIALNQQENSCIFEESSSNRLHMISIEDQFTNYCANKGFMDSKQSAIWFINLQRLGFLKIESYADVNYVEPDYDSGPSVNSNQYRYLYLTDFGKGFLFACSPLRDLNSDL